MFSATLANQDEEMHPESNMENYQKNVCHITTTLVHIIYV